MFQFGRFPTYTYVFSIRSVILHHGGFPIRISAGQGLFAAHRSFSQLVTSFVGSWCQGIPLMLFLAWTPLYISLYTRSLIAWIAVYHAFQLLSISLWQNCFFYPFGKTWFLKSRLFPLLNIKSVRVLNSSYSVFNEHCMLSPASFQPLTQLYISLSFTLNICIAA